MYQDELRWDSTKSYPYWEEVFWLSGVYESIMENVLKNQFKMSKNSKNKFSM
jgi:hypothetical protein